MEGLIYIIPVLLVFLFFFIKIFLLFKKFFSYISKNLSEINQEINDNYNSKQSENEAKNRYSFSQTIEKPEEDYVPIKDRDINGIAQESHENGYNKKNSEVNVQSEIKKSKDDIKKRSKNKDIKNTADKRSSLGNKFRNLNELEKAVVFKEILDKPRALRR